MIRDNILLMTDSYKVSHWKQYPKKTTRVFSFLESRGGEFPTTTFFGLSYIIKRYLEGVVVTDEKIDEAERLFAQHFGSAELFNRQGWEYISRYHRGRLPVIIRAVPEGTTVPTGNVLLTIENLDPEVPWLVNYLETLLVQVWYPTTVCTQSREMKRVLRDAMRTTGADEASLPFKLHDFGYRGSTSVESAGIGGAAHLVNFMGTDTLAALQVAHDYYFEPKAGFSIPAAEHSTITSWGRENERAAYENMLDSYPTGLVAVVSDSYDIFHAAEHIWGGELRDRVMQRDGCVVIRPDSGNPSYVVRRLLNILGEKFGYTRTAKGFKVLNPKVRLIQGDGIDLKSMSGILEDMIVDGWSVDNIAFGSGGGLLQKVNRDTCRFAMKCSAIEINGKWHDVMKQPATDLSKKSKPGRLTLQRDSKGGFFTSTEDQEAALKGIIEASENQLVKVFQSGVHYEAPMLSAVRERAAL
jgi:nicotinamide phosphoribosyltransferase